MLWRKSLVRHLTDFEQTVDFSEVTAQIPQLYFEKITEHRLESLVVEPICTETVWDRGRDRSASKDVLSSIGSVGKYSSHGNQTSRLEKGLLRVRPLSWHFLLWRVRVSCHLWTDGNPDGLRSGRFHNNEPLESWRQPAKPESIISVRRGRWPVFQLASKAICDAVVLAACCRAWASHALSSLYSIFFFAIIFFLQLKFSAFNIFFVFYIFGI